MMNVILVILLLAGTDGGRAVNTDIRFASMKTCEEAAAKIMRVDTMWKPIAVCIKSE